MRHLNKDVQIANKQNEKMPRITEPELQIKDTTTYLWEGNKPNKLNRQRLESWEAIELSFTRKLSGKQLGSGTDLNKLLPYGLTAMLLGAYSSELKMCIHMKICTRISHKPQLQLSELESNRNSSQWAKG